MRNSTEARRLYRCALQRYEDAEIPLRADHTTGAVYLAGYGVECILKTLVLMSIPATQQDGMLKQFRGGKAHDFEWLRSLYLTHGGPRFPNEVNRHFTLVSSWSTDLRSIPRQTRADEAEAFWGSTTAIIQWAKERL